MVAIKTYQLCIIIFSLRSTFSKRGIVQDILMGLKFRCPSTASKKIYSVTSEMQCTHRCIQHVKCKLINYNTARDAKENCEIFTDLDECSTKLGMNGWKAITLKTVSMEVNEERDVYVGCFIDTTTRALVHSVKLDTSMGAFIEQCIGFCKSRKLPYAGLQYATQCFCGTEYDKYGRANESDCNMKCNDGTDTICGGLWKNSVYKIG